MGQTAKNSRLRLELDSLLYVDLGVGVPSVVCLIPFELPQLGLRLLSSHP